MTTPDLDKRIAQFETMVAPGADPDNDMAWFSLGGAYAQAGRHADAANAYLRCTQINPTMSKAYQLAGAALFAAGDKGRAGQVLSQGFTIATERGDRMPAKAMADLLEQLGLPVPEVEGKQAPARPAGFAQGTFIDRKTGRPGTQMPRPPFKGPVGAWIHQHISAETFDAWIRQGTKVINEMRLDLSREDHAETYDQHMREYLGIDEDLYKELTARSS
jgi:Fe-S cluster biosynthesis and repair protein YggX